MGKSNKLMIQQSKALAAAVRADDLEAVREALRPMDLAEDDWDLEILDAAIDAAQLEIVAAIFDAGASPKAYTTYLGAGAATGSLSLVELLLNKKVLINGTNWAKVSALMQAAHEGQLEIARAILAKRCKVDLKDREHGQTALMLAAARGHGELVAALLDKGAKAELADKHGETALTLAAAAGHEAMVSQLEAAGADASRAQEVAGKGLEPDLLCSAPAEIYAYRIRG